MLTRVECQIDYMKTVRLMKLKVITKVLSVMITCKNFTENPTVFKFKK